MNKQSFREGCKGRPFAVLVAVGHHLPFWDGEVHLHHLCLYEYEYIIYARVATYLQGPLELELDK